MLNFIFLCKDEQERQYAVCKETFVLHRQEPGGAFAKLSDTEGAKLVKLNLAPGDVHIDALLSNFATGYTNNDFVADLVCPIKLVAKQSDKYVKFSRNDIFQPTLGAHSGDGGVMELPQRQTNAGFSTKGYFYGSYVPTEVQANADAPLSPFQYAARITLGKAALDREIRVATLLTAPSSYATAAQKRDLAALSKRWYNIATGAPDDGSDPILDIHLISEASVLKPTHMVFSEPVFNAFVRHPIVKSYVQYKDNINPIENADALSALLRLPKIIVASAKACTAASDEPAYIWGNNVCLLRVVSTELAGTDVGNAVTMRWDGAVNGMRGRTSEGTVDKGRFTRMFHDPNRGGLGGMKIVTGMYDAEVTTATDVGGLIQGAVSLYSTPSRYLPPGAHPAGRFSFQGSGRASNTGLPNGLPK